MASPSEVSDCMPGRSQLWYVHYVTSVLLCGNVSLASREGLSVSQGFCLREDSVYILGRFCLREDSVYPWAGSALANV